MPKPSAFSRFSEKTKKRIKKRQETNGFSDIDGLRNEIHELEPDYQISRTTTGRISKSMKDEAERIKKATDMAKQLLDDVGDTVHDPALANALMIDARIGELLRVIDFSDDEIAELSLEKRLTIFSKLVNAQGSSAKSQRFVAPERRTMKQETAALKDGQNNNEAKQRLAEKLAAILEKSKT